MLYIGVRYCPRTCAAQREVNERQQDHTSPLYLVFTPRSLSSFRFDLVDLRDPTSQPGSALKKSRKKRGDF